MEIATGKITGVTAEGLTVFVPYTNTERYVRRAYDQVQVGLPDGRTISPEQRRKAYALLREIADWSGDYLESVKDTTKHDFVRDHLQGLRKELFSLSSCDMTTAREYISYLIELVLTYDVPTRVPLSELCEDIQRYVYACLMHKKCAVCGKPCDLHHVDRVGMGSDRKQMDHIGLRCLPLCREHHQEAHDHGDAALMEKYHLDPVKIDEKIAQAYKLGGRKAKHEQADTDRKPDP